MAACCNEQSRGEEESNKETDVSSACWLPLESNPEVMNKYVNKLGVLTDTFKFTDIYGLDEELLGMVPRPVLAVLVLFPITDAYEEFRSAQEELITLNGQRVTPDVYYMKQTVGNACGTVAIIHSIANNTKILSPDPKKAIGKFLEKTKSMSPKERAKCLEIDQGIMTLHEQSAEEGQTEPPSREEPEPCLHFITYVCVDNELYELDGRRHYPVNHGKSSPDTLLEDASRVIKKLMAIDPNDVRFNVVALAPSC